MFRFRNFRAALRGGEIVAIGSGTQSFTILDRATTARHLSIPGWAPECLVRIGPEHAVLGLRHEQGEAAGWLLGPGNQVLADLARAAREPVRVATALAATSLAATLRYALAACTGDAKAWSALAALQTLDNDVLANLVQAAEPFSAVRAVTAAEDALAMPGDEEAPALVVAAALHNPAATLRNWQQVFRSGAVTLPSIFAEGERTDAWPIPITLQNRGFDLAFLCRDIGETCVRFSTPDSFAKNAKQFGAIYLPWRNLMVLPAAAAGANPIVARCRAVLTAVLTVLLATSAKAQARLASRPRELGLLLPASGQVGPHLGHALCDELGALDRALTIWSAGRPAPRVYHARPESGGGAAVFGALDELYPEIAGRTVLAGRAEEALSLAMAEGIQLFPLLSRFVPSATRQRIARSIAHSAAIDRDPLADKLPVIVFGLRLMNRRPADLGSFYARLAERLTHRLGSLAIVLDGLNGSEGRSGSIAPIYAAGSGVGKQISDGRAEIEAEHAFVSDLGARLEGLPVTLVSCVGMSLRANLGWLSQADFFVAPNGAGLAKLRWALDIPGFVLTSRINLEWCGCVDIYSSRKWMEPPFSPLHYTTAEEVEDLPQDPPRPPPDSLSFIPWPDNFTFRDEPALIARICDLAAAAVASRPDRHRRA